MKSAATSKAAISPASGPAANPLAEPSAELRQLREALDAAEEARLSPHAARSSQAVRRAPDDRLDGGHRQNFSADADRVLHSLAYSRYVDKTQVFSLIENDHITHRVLHVQFVSKIARTVGRLLALNEDLIEAIALAHDIGHCPFGHEGEACLSELCREHGVGYFHHAWQGVRFLEAIERKGLGWNLSLQVLDGVLCHDGEAHQWRLTPRGGKGFDDLIREMELRRCEPSADLVPMTLEGCVVRLCDTVSYIGRDIEDAIRVGLVNREDIPPLPAEVLGRTNGKIVYRLVSDLVRTSLAQPYVAFSPEVAAALEELKRFNLARIYLNPRIKGELTKIRGLFRALFERYLADLRRQNLKSAIFGYLAEMSEDYLASPPEAIVRDFIAGMTDDYFISRCQGLLLPERIQGGFR
jgi:dGTPase